MRFQEQLKTNVNELPTELCKIPKRREKVCRGLKYSLISADKIKIKMQRSKPAITLTRYLHKRRGFRVLKLSALNL